MFPILNGMDVYDFDGTIYRGDSTADFLRWCVRRHPRAGLALPRAGVAAGACFGLHAIDKTQFKRALYRCLRNVPDIEREVNRFWATHEERIGGPCAPSAGDLVISASPEFLLRGPCERRGLQLIASQVDPFTGRVLGPNCSGAEKVLRYRARFGDEPIERFFSDSLGDAPMAALAREAWLVDVPHDRLEEWPK